ncbi:MAG: RidA family protein [Armatimonadia bacterium]
MLKTIQSPDVPAPKTAYSQAMLAQGSKLLFISGQVPVDKDGKLVGEGDFRAQAHQIFRNLQANLVAAGASWNNVAKLTVLLTNMENFPIFNEVRQEYLQPDFPTATAAAITALVNPSWMIEIEAIAILD